MDLASWEGEVFLLGHWKNIRELEESLSLDELQLILNAIYTREERKMRFQAGLKGIDLGNSAEENSDRLEDVKRRAAARLSGKSVETLEYEELGIDIIED